MTRRTTNAIDQPWYASHRLTNGIDASGAATCTATNAPDTPSKVIDGAAYPGRAGTPLIDAVK